MDESFYRKLIDNLQDAVYFVDRNRVATYWNTAAERISGYLAPDVLGSSCADNILRHVDEEGRRLCLDGCPLAAVMEDGRVREMEVYMHHSWPETLFWPRPPYFELGGCGISSLSWESEG